VGAHSAGSPRGRIPPAEVFRADPVRVGLAGEKVICSQPVSAAWRRHPDRREG
jgi:hypothetical protein